MYLSTESTEPGKKLKNRSKIRAEQRKAANIKRKRKVVPESRFAEENEMFPNPGRNIWNNLTI